METLLILDEAYIEFAPDGTAVQVAIDDPRIIRMRTFSKGYGLAGTRVGYALGAQDLIGQFEKIRNHFGMNRAAQSAAEAALNDQAWLLSRRELLGFDRRAPSPLELGNEPWDRARLRDGIAVVLIRCQREEELGDRDLSLG